MDKYNINYVFINNNRKIKPGDKVLFYTDEKSFSWNNGFKIVHSFKNNMIGAYNINDEEKHLTYFNRKTLY